MHKLQFTKYINYKKPRFGTKSLHNLQLQSKVLMDLIFLLNISSDRDYLIYFGKVCHNFLPINLIV